MTRFSLFCHRCEDGLLDVDMQVRIELSWSYGLLGEMFVHHTLHTRAGEGLLSSHEFVGDATQSILVSFPAGDTTILLWCHIRRCARNGALLDANGGQHLGDAKVGQQCFPFGVEQDIFRFEVTMYNILLMHILKGLPHLSEDGDGFFHRQRVWVLTLEPSVQ